MLSTGRSRAAVAVLFTLNGFVWATWVAEIPSIQGRASLGPAALGATLLCAAAGGVGALCLAGQVLERFGSRRVASRAALALCALLPAVVFAPHPWTLRVALVMFGAANGLLDVSMNAEAVTVERNSGRPLMSSFHGLFSLGGWAGASAASAGMAAGLADGSRILGTAVVCAASALLVAGSLPSADRQAKGSAGRPGRLPRVLAAFGACTFLALLGEGAMGDWSAVYLRRVLGLSGSAAAQGFAAFSLAMAAARFAGDALVRWLGAATVLRGSAALGAVGLGGGLLVSRPVAGMIGFACVGFGLANSIPLLFGAAGRLAGVSHGRALAAVSATGYVGYLVGPPLIGLIAEHSSLTAGLGVVAAGCAFIAVLGGWLLGRREAEGEPQLST
jgi:fucose permease